MSYHLYTAAETRELDRLAIEQQGIAGATLMRRAGMAAFAVLQAEWPDVRSITVLCGAGNNAGDGYVVADAARAHGIAVQLIALQSPQKLAGDARRAAQTWLAHSPAKSSTRPLTELEPSFGSEGFNSESNNSETNDSKTNEQGNYEGWQQQPFTGEVIVDALLGTGCIRPVSGAYADVIGSANDSGKPILSLDIPSGLQASTGAVLTNEDSDDDNDDLRQLVIHATHTVMFIGRNVGLFTGQAARVVGQRHFADCGVSEVVLSQVAACAQAITAQTIVPLWQQRSNTAHKGSSGWVTAVGGDVGMPGAIRLCAEAALRIGAGRVAVSSHAEHLAVILAGRPELMFKASAVAANAVNIDAESVTNSPANSPAAVADELVNQAASEQQVWVCGPGLGRSAWSEQWLQQILSRSQRKVLDADALYSLRDYIQNEELRLSGLSDSSGLSDLGRATQTEQTAQDLQQWILTPHPGEAARLLDTSVTDIEQDRLAAARAMQKQYGGVVVLKGAGTIVTDGQQTWVNTSGNSALATGGTGDTLAGMLAGLLAQGYSLLHAALLGVWLHGYAAERLQPQGGPGLLASDLLSVLPDILQNIPDMVEAQNC